MRKASSCTRIVRKSALVVLLGALIALTALAASYTITLKGATHPELDTALMNCELAVEQYELQNLTEGENLFCNSCVASSCQQVEEANNTAYECSTFCEVSDSSQTLEQVYVLSAKPSGSQKLNGQNVQLEVITNRNATCRYNTIDVPYGSMGGNFAVTNNKTHSKQINLPDGRYTYYVKCRTDQGYEMSNSAIISFSLDTVTPSVVSYSPTTLVSTDYVDLQVQTDEQAECRYDTSVSIPFKNQRVFDATFLKTHTTKIRNLLNGQNAIYVSCKDDHNNILTDKEVIVRVDLAPSATISLDAPNPIPAGTIKVKLTTSEDLTEPPLLSYIISESGQELNNTQTRRIVPLTGSASDWAGYLFIRPEDTYKVGQFYFNGRDMEGTIGTRIMSGSTFYIDSLPPLSPVNLTATINKEDAVINIEWGEPSPLSTITYYNVYVSTQPGINLNSNYGTTTKTYFTWPGIETNSTYYIRISSVDSFGKESELTPEINVTWKKADTSRSTSENNNQDEIGIECSKEIVRVNTTLIDYVNTIEAFKNQLKRYEKETRYSDISIELKKIELDLGRIRNEIESTNVCRKEDSGDILKKLTTKLIELSELLPEEITVVLEHNTETEMNTEKITAAVNAIIEAENMNFTRSKKRKIQEQALKMAENSKNTIRIRVLEIKYRNSASKKQTFIEREITFQEELIEEGQFLTYELVPQDPVTETKLSSPEFNARYLENGILAFDIKEESGADVYYAYGMDSEMDAVVAREISMVIIPLDLMMPDAENRITGSLIGYVTNRDTMYNLLIILSVLVILSYVSYHGIKQRRKQRPKKMAEMPSVQQGNIKIDGFDEAGDDIKKMEEFLYNNQVDKVMSEYRRFYVANSEKQKRMTEEQIRKIQEIHRRMHFLIKLQQILSSEEEVKRMDKAKLNSLIDEINQFHKEIAGERGSETMPLVNFLEIARVRLEDYML